MPIRGQPNITPPPPARIWAVLASEAPRAVVFRRGPSRWTRLYLWDLATDTFTAGSWFTGNWYPWSCDLSPDGEHLLYMAFNEAKHREDRAKVQFGLQHFRGWTALCKPPWVRALGLWNASDSFSGGGVFHGNRSITLFHETSMRQPLIALQGFEVGFQSPRERESIVMRSLHRTGWQNTLAPQDLLVDGQVPRVSLQKGQLELHFVLRRYRWEAKYVWKGPHAVTGLSGASWADLDPARQLIYARAGVLYRHQDGQDLPIKDLNLDQFRRSKETDQGETPADAH